MNSNLKILSEGEFPLTMNQLPQTSTFLSPVGHSTFPISPSLQLSYPKQKAPVLSAFSVNDDKFPIAERCLNFDISSNDFSRNKLDITPCKTSFIGFQTSNQTPNYVSQKHKSDNAMELEIPAFTVEEPPMDRLSIENEDQSFKNLLQKIDLSHKNVSSSEIKPSSREKYPQPKKKNPSLLKQFKEKERVFPPKNSKGAQKFSRNDHMNMPMPLTHFTRSNSDVPPTLESHLGSFGAKEGSLGDNKYLNNLKDNKGADNKAHKVDEEKSKFEFPTTSRFDIFQSNNDNNSKGNDQKLRFAKNLFADFNEESGNGLFQIPERNFESEFPIDLKSPPKNDMDHQIEFEIENNSDSLVGLLNFKNENSRDFELEENKNLDFIFHGDEKNLSSPRKEDYRTPRKDILAFDNTPSLSQNRFFSTVTAKKDTTTRASMLFSDQMNSTNVTDQTDQHTAEFFSLRKGELTSSSRKDKKVKAFGTSRFENDYEVLEVLGSGDFGTVYKCRHKLDGLNYAVKCTNTKFKEDGNNHQMLNDLATLSALDENPFIVRYYSAWIEEEKLYIVMEYCQNNLRRFRSEFSKLSESTIRKIMRDVCSGLKFLHSQNIVHLALKPENILYSMTRKYKIADLGLSRIAQSSQTNDLHDGDYRYTAPELLNDIETAELSKADIYSLGVIIYELMTGSELLRHGQEWLDIRNGNLHKLDHLPFSNSLKSIIRSMTSGNPDQRPSAEELMASFLQSETELELRWEKKENRTLKRQIQELENQLKIHRKNSF